MLLALLTAQFGVPLAVAQSAAQGGAYVGVWTGGMPPTDVTALDDLGATWARVTAAWNTVQPGSANVYDWSALDRDMAAAAHGGLRRVLVVVRENPSWAAASRCRVTTDAERTNLATFAAALVRRYASSIPDGELSSAVVNATAWQFYNEPDNTSESFDTLNDLGGCFGTRTGTVATRDGRDAYASMLESAGAAVHEASPTAKVVSGGVVSGNWTELASPTCPVETSCIFDRGFLQGVLATLVAHNALDRLDEVAVHFYSSQASSFSDAGPDLVGRVAHLKQSMQEAGLTTDQLKPVLVDEGSYTGPADGSLAVRQRDYVSRVLARAAYARLDAYLWFWLRDTDNGLGSDVSYGLIDQRGMPKPAYSAFRYFARIVQRSEQLSAAITNPSPGFEGYEFAMADGRRLQIVWNDNLASYSPPGKVTAISDPVGTAVQPAEDGSILVSAEPRFIFLAAASPDSGSVPDAP